MFEISPAEWTAILLSLRVAVVATLVATPFGVALAWLLARRDFWGKSLLDAAVHLPLVLPPVVTGYLLLLTFGKRGLVGGWLADHLGIVFAFRWTGAALACGVMSFPLLVRPIRLSIEAVDRRLEQAAETLGAAPWRVFATVTLPLALPGVLAGMAFADKEQFRLLFLDKRNRLIADEVQQTGTVDHTPVYPREVIKRALELSATALILVHNHPTTHPMITLDHVQYR